MVEKGSLGRYFAGIEKPLILRNRRRVRQQKKRKILEPFYEIYGKNSFLMIDDN